MTENCTFKQEIYAKSGEWCNQEYIQLYSITGGVIARLKQEENKSNYLEVNLNLAGQGDCWYCNNEIKDYDEEGIDCGGSCISCSEIRTEALLKKAFGISNKVYLSILIGLVVVVFGLMIYLIVHLREQTFLFIKKSHLEKLFGRSKTKKYRK